MGLARSRSVSCKAKVMLSLRLGSNCPHFLLSSSLTRKLVTHQLLQLVKYVLQVIHDRIGASLSQSGNDRTIEPELVLSSRVEPAPKFLSQLPVIRQDVPEVVQLIGR